MNPTSVFAQHPPGLLSVGDENHTTGQMGIDRNTRLHLQVSPTHWQEVLRFYPASNLSNPAPGLFETCNLFRHTVIAFPFHSFLSFTAGERFFFFIEETEAISKGTASAFTRPIAVYVTPEKLKGRLENMAAAFCTCRYQEVESIFPFLESDLVICFKQQDVLEQGSSELTAFA